MFQNLFFRQIGTAHMLGRMYDKWQQSSHIEIVNGVQCASEDLILVIHIQGLCTWIWSCIFKKADTSNIQSILKKIVYFQFVKA